MKNSVKIACVIMGTVIGAGFASGQEIIQFFSIFREMSFWGILTSGILFCIISSCVLDYVYIQGINSYRGILKDIKCRLLSTTLNYISLMFLAVTFIIMIAGTGAYFHECYDIPYIIGSGAMALVCITIFMFNLKGAVTASTILTPFMFFGILVIGFFDSAAMLVFNVTDFGNTMVRTWFNSSFIYAGYNSIILIAILACMRPYVNSRRTAFTGGILGSVGLLIMAIVLNGVIGRYYPDIIEYELPVLHIAQRLQSILGSIYGMVLVASMLTSAVSTGYSFLNGICSQGGKTYTRAVVILCISAPIISLFGFSNLVKTAYPIFGYLGFLQIFVVLALYFSRLLHSKKL